MSFIKCYSTYENLPYTYDPLPSREKVIPDVDDAFAIRQKYFKHKWSDQLSNAVIVMYLLAQSSLLERIINNLLLFFQQCRCSRGRTGAVELRASDYGLRGPWFVPRPGRRSLWP